MVLSNPWLTKSMPLVKSIKLESVCCGVCGSDNWSFYASGKDYEYHTSDDKFQIVNCKICGNIYLNPRPKKEELSVIYPPNYYSYNFDKSFNSIALQAKDWLDKRKVKQWLSYLKISNPCFLDVGCGDGRYLKILHQLGVSKDKLYGVELSEDPIEYLKEQGFQGYFGRIEDITEELPIKSFDLIVILQVIEHVSDPRTLMKSLAGLLREGGILIVETPNTNSIDMKLFKRSYWGGYHFPRHWNLMNQETLTRLAKDYKLEVKTFNFLPAFSFWIFSFHHLIEDKWGISWLASFFNPFKNLILIALFTGFDIMRAKLGFQTSNIQMILVKNYD
jgi:SAM-dependent methyltransferase